MTASSVNHWLFQLANTFLFLSYGSKDVLLLRLLLMGAGVCFVLWGWLILAVSVDTVVWNSLFTVINAARATEVAWSRRPITFDREEHEQMYAALFGPVGIGRLPFKLLMEQGLLRKLRAGTTFLEAGNDASNLTLIFSGTMNIISNPKDGRPPEQVGTVTRMQFVESPQWANMQIKRRTPKIKPVVTSKILEQAPQTTPPNTPRDEEEGGSSFISDIDDDDVRADDVRAAASIEVTFKAATDIVYYTWPMERLHDFLRHHKELLAPVNALVGADVAAKLFRQSVAKKEETISALYQRVYMPMDEPITIVNDTEHPLLLSNPDEDTTVRMGSSQTNQSTVNEDVLYNNAPHSTSPLQAEKKWLERRGAIDTANDKQLTTFLASRTVLNKYELSALLAKGRWRTIRRTGTMVLRQGELVHILAIVWTGKLSVNKEDDQGTNTDTQTLLSGGKLHDILPGQMIGSIEFNEPEREHLAGETVTSLEAPCTYMEWELDDLRGLLGARPRLRAQFTALVAADVATKFRQVESSRDDYCKA